MTFTPTKFVPSESNGLDKEFKRQQDLLKDDRTAQEEFDEAQKGLQTAGEVLYNVGKAGIFLFTGGKLGALDAIDSLRNKIEGKPFKVPTTNPTAIDPATNLITSVNPYEITSESGTEIVSQLKDKITSNSPITITSTGNVPNIVAQKDGTDDIDTSNATEAQLKQAYDEVNSIEREMGTTSGAIGIDPKKESIVGYRQRMFSQSGGMKDNVFNLLRWQAFGRDRRVTELFQTRTTQTVKGQFKKTRDFLLPDFKRQFGYYLERFNIPDKNIELHHIFGVNLSAPLYDGLQYESPEWEELTNLLNKLGVYPGAPATDNPTESNFVMTIASPKGIDQPHDILHKQFFKDTIGVKGQKFFTPERMKLIREFPEERLKAAREYAEIIKRGEALINDAMEQLSVVFGRNEDPQKIANVLMRSLEDGSMNLIEDRYSVTTVNDVLRQVKAQFDEDNDALVEQLSQYSFESEDDRRDAEDLLGMIADYNEAKRFGYRTMITGKNHRANLKAFNELVQPYIPGLGLERTKYNEWKDFYYSRNR